MWRKLLQSRHWDAEARGAVLGLTRGVTKAHLVRAALEEMAYQTRDVVDAMVADGGRLRTLRVDGGAAANDFLMQFQADLLGVTVERPSLVETTAMGAAFLAGQARGVWRGPADLERARRIGTRFRPGLSKARREALQRGWREAVARVRTP
jgi:glycerol kinase